MKARRRTVEEMLRAGDFAALEADLDRTDLVQSFEAFARAAWPVLEPRRSFVEGLPTRAICSALQAVTEGRIRRVLINVPPGCTKSMLVNVLWPAWEWARGMRANRYISCSYDKNLATRDLVRCRDLICSQWFQERWPIRLKDDENNKTKYDNTETGWRMAASVGSSLTGYRGDRIIVDDPHSIKLAESDVERATALLWWRETVQTRLNDVEQSAIVVIMQRVHTQDIAGWIIANQPEYTVICLPMRYEAGRHCKVEAIGFEDPRREEGDLLWPSRFPGAWLDELERNLGPYAFAGQYQQRPVPRDGGMFPRKFARFWEGALPPGRSVRAWDLAASKEKRSAWTVGLKMRKTSKGEIIIEHVIRAREEPPGVERLLRGTAEADGRAVPISVPQDPGQAGKTQKLAIARLLDGWNVHFSPESGEKPDRAIPLSAQWAAGNVYLMPGPWNEAFLDELAEFPGSTYLDQGDAASRAHAYLLANSSEALTLAAPEVWTAYDSMAPRTR